MRVVIFVGSVFGSRKASGHRLLMSMMLLGVIVVNVFGRILH